MRPVPSESSSLEMGSALRAFIANSCWRQKMRLRMSSRCSSSCTGSMQPAKMFAPLLTNACCASDPTLNVLIINSSASKKQSVKKCFNVVFYTIKFCSLGQNFGAKRPARNWKLDCTGQGGKQVAKMKRNSSRPLKKENALCNAVHFPILSNNIQQQGPTSIRAHASKA